MVRLALGFLGSGNGIIAAIMIGVTAFIGYSWKQRSIGAEKERARIETQDRNNVELANEAGADSRSGTTRGLRTDPYVRDVKGGNRGVQADKGKRP